jgi:hypothetical protein
MRKALLPLAALSVLPLGGCVAGIAASAVGAAVRSAQKPVDPNLDVAPAGRDACTARAAQEGEVHIIDVEPRGPGKVIVWGTVQKDGARRSFECRFNGKIASFTLREIGATR